MKHLTNKYDYGTLEYWEYEVSQAKLQWDLIGEGGMSKITKWAEAEAQGIRATKEQVHFLCEFTVARMAAENRYLSAVAQLEQLKKMLEIGEPE